MTPPITEMPSIIWKTGIDLHHKSVLTGITPVVASCAAAASRTATRTAPTSRRRKPLARRDRAGAQKGATVQCAFWISQAWSRSLTTRARLTPNKRPHAPSLGLVMVAEKTVAGQCEQVDPASLHSLGRIFDKSALSTRCFYLTLASSGATLAPVGASVVEIDVSTDRARPIVGV